MTLTEFQNYLTEISETNWENNLPIGKFNKIEILHFFTRRFSYIARCRVQGDTGHKNVFVKVYRNPRNRPPERRIKKIKEAFEISDFWYQLFTGSQKFSVVRPVLVIPEKFILVTEESQGENLYNLILENAKFFPSSKQMLLMTNYLKNVGGWLQYKNSQEKNVTGRYSIDKLIEYMDVRLKILTEDPRRRFPLSYRDQILKFMDKNKNKVDEADLLIKTCHSDFNPGNILVKDEKVTVLDFGKSGKGSYILDLSKLYYQLNLFSFKPQYRLKVIRKLQRAILTGFGNTNIDKKLMFRFMLIRHSLTHLKSSAIFRKKSITEKMYGLWVHRKELQILDDLLNFGE